ncbi:transcriptional regulator [Vibrio zhanjiangensis]|uniref:Transcriptional regulator n=1 Tax=Vibrio zhanjiangensis TaxID=1046128 RepID=A0ABQ6EUY6_9VIBR|nr:helix-turn-helix transcriptional regulator [Vibrio zhanjiangensis]GLT16817.1 transcriptional regulator [Vibrio zhanjiangensis]
MLSRQSILTENGLTANEIIAKNPNSPVLVKTIEMSKGYVDSMHYHDWHQIIFPIKGLLQTQSGNYQYLLPHTSALFVPASLKHESIALSSTTFIGIYINPTFGQTYEDKLRTLYLTPFLKQLLQEIRRTYLYENAIDQTLRLLDVLHDQVYASEVVTFQLLLPQDRRLKFIFNQLTENPTLDWSLKIWGDKVGASERTLSRLFFKEFNTSFPRWRQHLRLIYSLPLLDEDLPIQIIADKIGYKNDSSYIKAFKSYFDLTPQQFRLNKNHQYSDL